MATPTVKVVKGSVDEAILKQQYGNSINYDYLGGNQFSGADRVATNKQYQDALSGYGLKANDAGDLWGYQGLTKGTDSFNQQASQDRFDSLAQGYADKLNAANAATAEAQRIAREGVLRNAFQSNSQALNSQKSTVTNNFDSMTRQLNATKESQLPQYQQQRDAASQDAAAQLRRTQALNALSGKFFSGANRSQMLGVDLAKQNAIGGINQAQNQFNTDITNRLSDADAQRVAALNDIAQKLNLNQQQYNQGTLDLTNQIESEKAAKTAQALAEGMKWAQDIQQQGVDNSLRQGQFDLNRDIFNAGEAWKGKTFGADQENQAFERALAITGLLGQTYGVPGLANGITTADQAYRMAGTLRPSTPKAPTSAEINSQRDQSIGQVTLSIYNKVYGKSSNEEAFSELTNNKSSILADLVASGMGPSEALKFYQQMYNDLLPTTR